MLETIFPPTQVTICTTIIEFEFRSCSEDRGVKITAPLITRQCVLIPEGFPLESRSAPMAKPAASAIPIDAKKNSSQPVGICLQRPICNLYIQ